MKNFFLILMFLVLNGPIFSYDAKINIQVGPREAAVQINYIFAADYESKYKIDLPARSKLISLTTASHGNFEYSKNGDSIWLMNFSNKNEGKIILTYTMPIRDIEFYLSNWLATVSEEGTITATINAPEKFKSLFIPYEKRNPDGYSFKQSDNPIIICCKFNNISENEGDTHIEVFYPFKMISSARDLVSIFKSYQQILFPLKQKNLILIHLTDLKNTVRFTTDNIFIVINPNINNFNFLENLRIL